MTEILKTINVSKLNEDIASLGGLPISVSPTRVWYDENTLTAQQITDLTAIVDAHDPVILSDAQIHENVKAGAKAELSSIPNYATWTQAQADNWIDANVTDLASAKTAISALAKMVIAIRNELYPDLQG